VSETNKPKTARSYRATVVGDNTVVSINLKWLGQMLILVASLVYGYYRIETRIADLERGIQLANEEIEELVSKHIAEDEVKIAQMQEQLEWYQKELNLNPLSWGKKRKNRK
jgi:uncharacterized coiled-coil protein SlyX|tara:strand:+ start:597 stop:929 length:333 start_codon:yes stop_codon:yes gene_type:complete